MCDQPFGQPGRKTPELLIWNRRRPSKTGLLPRNALVSTDKLAAWAARFGNYGGTVALAAWLPGMHLSGRHWRRSATNGVMYARCHGCTSSCEIGLVLTPMILAVVCPLGRFPAGDSARCAPQTETFVRLCDHVPSVFCTGENRTSCTVHGDAMESGKEGHPRGTPRRMLHTYFRGSWRPLML